MTTVDFILSALFKNRYGVKFADVLDIKDVKDYDLRLWPLADSVNHLLI